LRSKRNFGRTKNGAASGKKARGARGVGNLEKGKEKKETGGYGGL